MPVRPGMPAVVGLTVLFATVCVQAAPPQSIPTLNVLDHRGGVHALAAASDHTARVFVFLTHECPISKSYVPTLRRLSEKWRQSPHEVTMYGVWADATTPPDKIAKFAEDYQIEFPILLDFHHTLAKSLVPKFVPEAVVLDTNGRVVYRGRIDDTYTDLGRRRQEPTTHDLDEAVAATVAGKPPRQSETAAVGCHFELLTNVSAEGSEVTYTRDVAPILFANCVVCHRAEEIAPFSLTSYEDAAKRAQQIVTVVERRLMPPWNVAQIQGEFRHQRTLSDEQIETLRLWASTGRTEGDPQHMPPSPQFETGWRLGPPDLILEMSEDFEIPADGPDVYQNFVIPVDIPEDKAVAGIQFVPGNTNVVHHSLLYLDTSGKARRLDAKSAEPGYSTFGGPGFLPSGSIGGWSPGTSPQRLPDGYGRPLKKGADLVMQNHYHPTGKIEHDRSKVAIYFTDEPKYEVHGIWVSSHVHDISPGDASYRLKSSFTLPCDVVMFGVIPHMHLLGQTMKAIAVLPDGGTQELIDVERWDFNWQDDYRFTKPLQLAAGTRLEVEASYDNSAANPSNPNSPPQRVRWGEETTDEMFYCFFLVAPQNPEQVTPLMRDVLATEITNRAKAKSLQWMKAPVKD